MSRCLSDRSIDHVVLERGEVAHAWRTERWDSLRLLTPNWLSRLPDYAYSGSDPDGFMNVNEVVNFIAGFAASTSAPVRSHTLVTSVKSIDGRYRIETARGEIRCRAVVLATGANNSPRVPELHQSVPRTLSCLTTFTYRNPQQ